MAEYEFIRESDETGLMVCISTSSLLHNTTPSFVSASVWLMFIPSGPVTPCSCVNNGITHWAPLLPDTDKDTLYRVTLDCSQCIIAEKKPTDSVTVWLLLHIIKLKVNNTAACPSSMLQTNIVQIFIAYYKNAKHSLVSASLMWRFAVFLCHVWQKG